MIPMNYFGQLCNSGKLSSIGRRSGSDSNGMKQIIGLHLSKQYLASIQNLLYADLHTTGPYPFSSFSSLVIGKNRLEPQKHILLAKIARMIKQFQLFASSFPLHSKIANL